MCQNVKKCAKENHQKTSIMPNYHFCKKKKIQLIHPISVITFRPPKAQEVDPWCSLVEHSPVSAVDPHRPCLH